MSDALKYKFGCKFSDGTIYNQTPDDKPIFSETGSSFTDVVKRIDDVVLFWIYSEETDIIAKVDLTTGLFAINDIPFVASDPSQQFPHNTKFRLIFFRRHRHTSNVALEELAHEIEFHIGWQCTINGKNYQQTIALG